MISLAALAATAAILLVGQEVGPPEPTELDGLRPEPGWKRLGDDLWFDPATRRLALRARVCLREGYLEHLLCSSRSKEHESILATDAPPRAIHAGLLLTGAEPGATVQFVPEFKPPRGTPIVIEARWLGADGKEQAIDVRSWVREQNGPKHLTDRWVFAGSHFVPDPDNGPLRYAAESGDLITVSNFMSAILDVPFASSASDAERSFVADTERIPPLDTSVTLWMYPAPKEPGKAAEEHEPAPSPPAPDSRAAK